MVNTNHKISFVVVVPNFLPIAYLLFFKDRSVQSICSCTKLGRGSGKPNDCAAAQRDLNKLVQWENRNKGKCQVLHLGRKNSLDQYMLGDNQQKHQSSVSEKGLRNPVNNKLKMSQCCASAAQEGQ